MDVLKALLSLAAGRAVLATVLVLGTFGLLFTDREVPLWLVALVSSSVTFFFTALIQEQKNGR